MTWHDSISQNVGPASIADIRRYVVPSGAAAESPIDMFYRASRDLLLVGTPTFLSAHPSMGPLLMVGLVSTTENYFRDILTRVIRLCPISRAASADQAVKLGSVVWHGGVDAERGAFEHLSFAGGDNIISTAKKFTGYNIRRTTVVDEFDRVCDLRHGIVHSSAILPGKNAIRLNLPATSTAQRIVVSFAELQEVADVCTSLVVSVNQELFVELCRRWNREWPLKASWLPSRSHAMFKSVWQTFHSEIDKTNGTIPSPMSLMRCKNSVSNHAF